MKGDPMKVIYNVNLVLPEQIIFDGIIFFDHQIRQIAARGDLPVADTIELIDGKGGFLTPGLLDIHIHGSGGFDTMEGTYQALDNMSKSVVKSGVTGFLPTTMTLPMAEIKKALANIAYCRREGVAGARILGANMEGPFINKQYKGAQAEAHILKPDFKLIADYLDLIKVTTVAPEVAGAEELIRALHESGIVIAAGHSGAECRQVLEAMAWGLSHATHLFNAMTGMHHRKPGVVGAVLATELTCEIIADNIHIDPLVLKVVAEVKDPARLILITDSMEAGGLADGEYSLGGQQVIVRDSRARLEDGVLAGSVLTMDRAIINMLNASKLPLNQVVNMATLNPARLLKLEHRLGSLREGLSADLALFDSKLNVQKVYIGGVEKYGYSQGE
jgi:N-acetylglucosamine-6-phosphate deacetylase